MLGYLCLWQITKKRSLHVGPNKISIIVTHVLQPFIRVNNPRKSDVRSLTEIKMLSVWVTAWFHLCITEHLDYICPILYTNKAWERKAETRSQSYISDALWEWPQVFILAFHLFQQRTHQGQGWLSSIKRFYGDKCLPCAQPSSGCPYTLLYWCLCAGSTAWWPTSLPLLPSPGCAVSLNTDGKKFSVKTLLFFYYYNTIITLEHVYDKNNNALLWLSSLPCQGLYCLHPILSHLPPLLSQAALWAAEGVESEHIHLPVKAQGVDAQGVFWCSQLTGGSHGEWTEQESNPGVGHVMEEEEEELVKRRRRM